MSSTSAGEVAKEHFEDLSIIAWHGNGKDEALERVLTRTLRALANIEGATALGVRQGTSRFVAMRYPARAEDQDG